MQIIHAKSKYWFTNIVQIRVRAVNHFWDKQRNHSILHNILSRSNNNVWVSFKIGIYIIEQERKSRI